MLPYAHSGPPPHLSEATAHAFNNTCTSKLPAHDQLLAEKEVSGKFCIRVKFKNDCGLI